jgi:uncharacterized protein YsxB (DUF464 family)
MIRFKTWDAEGSGVGFELTGHASTSVEDIEGKQVCAGVSALMMTLWCSAGRNGHWGGNSSGELSFVCEPAHFEHARFAIAGVLLIADSYPGRIELELGDTRIERVQWLPQPEPT